MDVKATLSDLAPRVDQEIVAILEKEQAYAASLHPFLGELFPHIQKLSAGGKRLRAALTYYSYVMHGGQADNPVIWTIAALIEITHTYILIEDDIMDQDDRRRGQDTLHRIYHDLHQANHWRGDNPRHFGESVALSAALIIAHLTQRVLAETKPTIPNLASLLECFHRNLIDTGYGQVLDIQAEALPEIGEREVEQILLLKTARYTYQNPLEIGAILAGAKPQEIKKLSSYAIPAGIAFQVQDDILGMFGDESKTGKPADSDLKEGKRNLLTVYTLKNAKQEQRKRFGEFMGNPQITPEMLQEARQIIIDSGSLDHSRQRAQALVVEAQEALRLNPQWQGEGRAFLEGIADYMIKRDV